MDLFLQWMARRSGWTVTPRAPPTSGGRRRFSSWQGSGLAAVLVSGMFPLCCVISPDEWGVAFGCQFRSERYRPMDRTRSPEFGHAMDRDSGRRRSSVELPPRGGAGRCLRSSPRSTWGPLGSEIDQHQKDGKVDGASPWTDGAGHKKRNKTTKHQALGRHRIGHQLSIGWFDLLDDKEKAAQAGWLPGDDQILSVSKAIRTRATIVGSEPVVGCGGIVLQTGQLMK